MTTTIAVLIAGDESPLLVQTVASIQNCPMIQTSVIAVPSGMNIHPGTTTILSITALWSKQAILDGMTWFRNSGADHLLLITGSLVPVLSKQGMQRMIGCLSDTGASIVYGDYFDTLEDGSTRLHPLIDYQQGSIRDTFNFGPVVLLNGRYMEELQHTIASSSSEYAFGGWYDLRLRLSEKAPICHLPEPLYCCGTPSEPSGSSHFSYVDPRNRNYQIEMECIATAHLLRIGAHIAAPKAVPLKKDDRFPVKASVIIPVRNRHRTIGDAVASALSQQTTFPFNVIVVDNHSTDGTTEILSSIARSDARLIHRIPERNDLLIGGCWNEAIFSEQCGEYAVQLDSDDIYDGAGVLSRIVGMFEAGSYALVIGSYTTVNFDLKRLPPGLIDHREWSDVNGMNNALRIAGLGAPRAYHVPVLRTFGFPNVSYGEDYAVVLRLSRSYPVGRIYDSLYWCRRWEENSDSKLSIETSNRYDHFKDRLRSVEIAARINREACR